MSGSSGMVQDCGSNARVRNGFFRCSAQNRIVDKPRGAYPGGDGEERAGNGYVDWLERGRVNESDEVDAYIRFRGKDAMCRGDEHGRAALALGDERLHLANRTAEREGLTALRRCEVSVARAERKAVRVADD